MINSDFISMMMNTSDGRKVSKENKKMRLVSRHEKACNSVKVSFSKRSDRAMMMIYIGRCVCEEMNVSPGEHFLILSSEREFKIVKSEKSNHSYKLQQVTPISRNNFRIVMTWKLFIPKNSDYMIKVVKHKVLDDKSLIFSLDDIVDCDIV